MISGLVFDIDDTLYDEIDYVRSGFAHIARIAARPDVNASTLERWLYQALEAGVRGDTFDQMLIAFPSVAMHHRTSRLIEEYRSHPPKIHLDPAVALVLDELLGRGLRLGVLSDGQPHSQRAKVVALELARWFDPIILTGSLGPTHAKPATTGFEAIARAWAFPAEALGYVADNPEKDFAGPRRLGWATIRLRHGRQLRCDLEPVAARFSPDLQIGSLRELLGLLRHGSGSTAS